MTAVSLRTLSREASCPVFPEPAHTIVVLRPRLPSSSQRSFPVSAFDGAVMITASHLPFNRNGMKFFTKDGGLEKADITEILMTAAEKDISVSETVNAESFDLVSAYSRRMMGIIKEEVGADDYDHPLKGLHIVVDAGNGASGFFASRILEPLGADISGSVFLDPDM